jgi:transcriptional regulator with XRE-family HTH domain
MTLGERIRKRRQLMKLTQQELGKALGLTSQHISAIEQDKRTPSLASLAKIAEELGVSVDYLLTGQEEGVITDTIPAIKADKKLKLEVKKALITLVRALYGGED